MANSEKRKEASDNTHSVSNPKKSKPIVKVNSNWEIFLEQSKTASNKNATQTENITSEKKQVVNDKKGNPKTSNIVHKCVIARPKLKLTKKVRALNALLPKSMKLVAMDCEMVEISDGSSILARVSLVDSYCNSIYDTFVKPREEVKDYRTHVSGVRKEDIENAKSFEKVQLEVANILKGSILVGHALKNDLRVLYLGHSKKHIRDTAKYKPFRTLNSSRTPSLKFLAKAILNQEIQTGEHDSIIDAKTCMLIYHKHRVTWEKELRNKSSKKDISS